MANEIIRVKTNTVDTWNMIGNTYIPAKGQLCIIISDRYREGILLDPSSNEEGDYVIGIKFGDGENAFATLPLVTNFKDYNPDWNETDALSPRYIKNKPLIDSDLFENSEIKQYVITMKDLISKEIDAFSCIQKENIISVDEDTNDIIISFKEGSLPIELNENTEFNDSLLKVYKNNSNIYYYDTETERLFKWNNNSWETTAEPLPSEEELIKQIDKYMYSFSANSTYQLKKGDKTYIKISNRDFHPNNLLIFDDDMWGHYEFKLKDEGTILTNNNPRFFGPNGSSWAVYENDQGYINYIRTEDSNGTSYFKEENIVELSPDKTQYFISKKLNDVTTSESPSEDDPKIYIIKVDGKYSVLNESPEDTSTIEKTILKYSYIKKQYKYKDWLQFYKNSIIKENLFDSNNLENLCYILNDQIVLNISTGGIYMDQKSLEECANIGGDFSIIFYYRDRTISKKYFGQMTPDWNENNPESIQYIQNRPMWINEDGQVVGYTEGNQKKPYENYIWNLVYQNWMNEKVPGDGLDSDDDKSYAKVYTHEGRIGALEKDIVDLKTNKANQNEVDERFKEIQNKIDALNLTEIFIANVRPPEEAIDKYKIWIDTSKGNGILRYRVGKNWEPISAAWTSAFGNNDINYGSNQGYGGEIQDGVKSYSVTYQLSGVTSSNTSIFIPEGVGFGTILSCKNGYTGIINYQVYMSNQIISSGIETMENGSISINIPEVTGAITIIASSTSNEISVDIKYSNDDLTEEVEYIKILAGANTTVLALKNTNEVIQINPSSENYIKVKRSVNSLLVNSLLENQIIKVLDTIKDSQSSLSFGRLSSELSIPLKELTQNSVLTFLPADKEEDKGENVLFRIQISPKEI